MPSVVMFEGVSTYFFENAVFCAGALAQVATWQQ
jgi:hypothetical protein